MIIRIHNIFLLLAFFGVIALQELLFSFSRSTRVAATLTLDALFFRTSSYFCEVPACPASTLLISTTIRLHRSMRSALSAEHSVLKSKPCALQNCAMFYLTRLENMIYSIA